MKLIPVGGRNTPQNKLAKEIAVILAQNGVEDTGCLPVAIQIMAVVQSTLDAKASIPLKVCKGCGKQVDAERINPYNKECDACNFTKADRNRVKLFYGE